MASVDDAERMALSAAPTALAEVLRGLERTRSFCMSPGHCILRAVLMPFSKKNWRRTLAHDEASPTSPGVQPAQRKFARPVDDENAPDLCAPAFASGAGVNRFC